MSSAIHLNWLHHFRALKGCSSMVPVTQAEPAPAPFPPELDDVTPLPNGRLVPRREAAPAPEPAIHWVKLAAHGVSCEVAIVLVTPELAARYLKNQRRNRNLKRRQVEFLARQLGQNDWMFNGEPLIFDAHQRMLDGQHRCGACVKSGLPFLTLVVRGIATEAFDRIDCGTKRTGGDVLRIEGVAWPTLSAATLAKMLQHRVNGEWWDAGDRPSGHELLRHLPDFPGIEEHYADAAELGRQLGGGPSLWAVALFLTFEIDEPTATLFWEKVLTGIGLEPGDPELRLRQRLLDVRSTSGKVEFAAKQYAALIAFAWNYRRKGRKIQALRGLHGNEPVPAFL